MTTSSQTLAGASGTFLLGGDLPVHRLGYGTMQLTGPGVWGDPADPAEAVRVLRRAVELGVTLIDTADSYGPFVTDAPDPPRRCTRTRTTWSSPPRSASPGRAPGSGPPVGRPEYLRQQVELNLRHLGVERIDLLQLHRIDPTVPVADQIGELAALQSEGKIAHIGLSEVSVAQIEQAQEDRADRLRAEPLQPGRPRRRGRAGLQPRRRTSRSFRGSRWPPASCRSPAARWPKLAKQHDAIAVAARAGLVAAPLAGDAADSRHLVGRASGGQPGGRADRTHRRRVRRADQRCLTLHSEERRPFPAGVPIVVSTCRTPRPASGTVSVDSTVAATAIEWTCSPGCPGRAQQWFGDGLVADG